MKNALREKAQKLRKAGLSYGEIRKEIGVAKSTLSIWLKDIRLSADHRKRLYTRQVEILSRGAMSQKERRAREIDAIIEKSLKEISFPVSEETYKLFGVALYWAEGSKGKKFEITNSDPYMILLMVEWLKKIFCIDPQNLKPHLNIYSQQDESDLKEFWSELTGIPITNFGKSYIKPSNKNFKKNNLYYGTIKIYIPRGTDTLHIVYGWRKAILQSLKNKVNFTERKWISLKETSRPVNLPERKRRPL